MRILSFILFILPTIGTAEGMFLKDILGVKDYVLAEATCTEIGSLFTVPAEDAANLSDEFSVGLLFVTSYLEGISHALGEPYGAQLVKLSAFCTENPDSHWADFH